MKKEKDKKKRREKQELLKPTAEPMLTKIKMAEPDFSTNNIEGMLYLRQALDVLGGKWRLQVLWSLREGEGLRYGKIKNEIPGITDMMLSQSLRELCQFGLVTRQQYQEIPPRVEYQILPGGVSLLPLIRQLIDWQKERVSSADS